MITLLKTEWTKLSTRWRESIFFEKALLLAWLGGIAITCIVDGLDTLLIVIPVFFATYILGWYGFLLVVVSMVLGHILSTMI